MIRISTTTIEQDRRLVEYDYVDGGEFIAGIRGEGPPPSWQMCAGTAWDKVLAGNVVTVSHPSQMSAEALTAGASSEVIRLHEMGYDGFRFDPADVAATLQILGPGEWQIKATKIYQWPGSRITTTYGQVEVVGKADHLRGLVCTDVKATFSALNPEDRERDLQWRFYLMIFGSKVFRYVLCQFKEPDDNGYCELKDVLPFRMWPHDGMEEMCMEWLERFLEFCEQRDLIKFLVEKQR